MLAKMLNLILFPFVQIKENMYIENREHKEMLARMEHKFFIEKVSDTGSVQTVNYSAKNSHFGDFLFSHL